MYIILTCLKGEERGRPCPVIKPTHQLSRLPTRKKHLIRNLLKITMKSRVRKDNAIEKLLYNDVFILVVRFSNGPQLDFSFPVNCSLYI